MSKDELYGDLDGWRRQRILIVEDDENIRRLIVRILEKEGFVIMEASSGQMALDMAAEHPNIDLLITDMIMRGVSGVDLAARLKADRPGLPILFTSGYSQQQIGKDFTLPKDAEFIAKPWTSDELRAAALRLIGPKHRNIG